jgi:DtxR family Mn-dependent transcriptional regulator
LVTHEPYRGVKLTEKGQKIALSVLRRHRLAERLLTDILHLDWNDAHPIACKLEHAIVPGMIKPLEKTLGHPTTCPHGNPIPTKCGGILEEPSEPLVNLQQKDRGTIVKITEETAEVLTRLASLGLTPGVDVAVENNSSFHGLITIRVDEATHTLDYAVASVINVKRNG